MKEVRFHRIFTKHFRIRILPHKKLVEQFESRLTLFVQGVRDAPLLDHPLGGSMKGLRAFSVGGDLRVIYKDWPDYYEFLDIGSHNQVY